MEASWVASQKKAFTRWANHVLSHRGMVIHDIDKDLRTGSVLIYLLEILSGEVLSPRKMSSGSGGHVHVEGKIQSFTNATKALKFIEQQGINLVNCRPEHIVDNNSKMVLGLLWRIITKYHIQPSIIEDDMLPDAADKSTVRVSSLMNKSTRDSLLKRCKIELEPYNIVPTNLTKSFQSPGAFAALVHRQKPDSINMDEIASMEPAVAFTKIFNMAETELGIPQILDPSDLLDVSGTDECSVMTYIAYFLKKGPTHFPQPKLQRGRSQGDVIENMAQRRHSDAPPVEELNAENFKLREENRVLTEYIKAHLEKFKLSMQNASERFEDRTTLMDTKTLALEVSLSSLTRTTSSLIAENGKLRARAVFLEADKGKLHSQLASMGSENSRLRMEVISLQNDRVNVEAALLHESKMQAEMVKLIGDKDLVAYELGEVRSEYHKLREEVEALRRANEALRSGVKENGEEKSSPETPPLEVDPMKSLSHLRLNLADVSSYDSISNSSLENDSPRSVSSEAQEMEKSESQLQQASEVAAEKSIPSQVEEQQPKMEVVDKKIQALRDEVTPGGPEYSPRENRKSRRHTLSGQALKEHEIVTAQSVVRRWLAKRWLRRARRRRVVAAELVSTEKTYVQCLQTMMSEFFQPLRSMAADGTLSQTLNENLLKTIFNNAEVISNINSNLLMKLEQRWNKWNYYQKIGDVFLSTIEFLKCYNQYVNHYNRSLDALAECGKISAFNDFLKVKALKCGHHLRDLLIVPVQRIPRYVILLEEMARYTDSTHPDHKDLTLALSKMHNIADYVNEKKRDFEALAQVSAIQDTLVGISILEYPRLRFLIEGDLVSEEGKKVKQFHVFLFNEIFLCTKLVKKVFGDRKQKQVKYKYLELIKFTPDTKVSKRDCSFTIETSPNSPPKKFTTTSEKERDNWAQNIQNSIDKMIEAKRTKAIGERV